MQDSGARPLPLIRDQLSPYHWERYLVSGGVKSKVLDSLTNLHDESSIEEELGGRLRLVDILDNRGIENSFSGALVIKMSGVEVILKWLLQRRSHEMAMIDVSFSA